MTLFLEDNKPHIARFVLTLKCACFEVRHVRVGRYERAVRYARAARYTIAGR